MHRDVILKLYRFFETLLTRRVKIVCDRIPFEFHGVPLKKLLNRYLVHASFHFKPDRPWGWPTHLQIEPDARCNLHCLTCPVTTGLGRPQGRMTFSLFKKLIDEVADYVFLILMWDWGEPFLNPDIYKMIAYAKTKGIQLISSSNGQLLAHRTHVDNLIRSELDWLIIALDGVTQETYERYRQGGELRNVLKGIQKLIERKRVLNAKTPRINLRFVVMKQNEHEIPELRKLAENLCVDALTLKTMNPYDSGITLLPENPHYRRFQYTSGGAVRVRRSHNPCLHLWHAPAIHWNGAVCMCTYDSKEEHVFGNLQEAPFKRIWTNNAYRAARKQFRSAWQQNPLCNQCSYAYVGGSCIDEIIADALFFSPNAKGAPHPSNREP